MVNNINRQALMGLTFETKFELFSTDFKFLLKKILKDTVTRSSTRLERLLLEEKFINAIKANFCFYADILKLFEWIGNLQVLNILQHTRYSKVYVFDEWIQLFRKSGDCKIIIDLLINDLSDIYLDECLLLDQSI